MKYDRIWAMPSSATFTIKPIRDLLIEEISGELWADPFAGYNSPASLTNDLNPDTPTTNHEDALHFLSKIGDNTLDGVLFDPPYSVRQLAECYKSVGLAVTQELTRPNYWSDAKRAIARILKPEGKAICFGWNSGGIGILLGFNLVRILLVPHGGIHNDTIITVEYKNK